MTLQQYADAKACKAIDVYDEDTFNDVFIESVNPLTRQVLGTIGLQTLNRI